MRSGTRESHNKLEKNRRAQMRACFLDLKEALPKDQEEKKTSNLSILSNALKYIMVSGRRRLFRYVFSIPIRAELRSADSFRGLLIGLRIPLYFTSSFMKGVEIDLELSSYLPANSKYRLIELTYLSIYPSSRP